MIPRHKAFLFLAVNIALIVGFAIVSRGQIIETEIVWPESMHSNHDKQCDPWCAQQDNGGFGGILTVKGTDKFYNLGLGRIYFTNSFNDPGRVDIFQLMEVEFELELVRFGLSIWKMWIYGYYEEYNPRTRKVVHDVPPWPVPFFGINPLYLWTKDFYVSARRINFPGVYIDFVMVSWRYNF